MISCRHGVIYKITNKINGKSYIGQTIQSLGERWSKHKGKHSKSKILNLAIKKYGEENFEIEPIASATKRSHLSVLEVKLINDFNTLSPNGYDAVILDENYTMS